jgi:pimeloyl-ACP methyl ester carboxylesterase
MSRQGVGEPLVLLHGGGGSWHDWEPVVPLLRARHEVCIPALPGHLDGREVPRPVTIAGLAEGVTATLREAGIETAHLAGVSLGGWVAMELARRGLARSVVAFSPAGGFPAGDTRVGRYFVRTRRVIERTRPLLPMLLRSRLVRRAVFRRVTERGDLLTVSQALGRADALAAVSWADEAVEFCSRPGEPYGDLGVPVLIAWAERDRQLPAPRYSDHWRRAVANASWRTLPGVGHIPMYEAPELVARTILDWTAVHSGAR